MPRLLFISAALAFSLLTSGCVTDIPPSTALFDGPSSPAPAGWVDYCARHQEDSGCR